jgi:hypothetical protein
MLLLIIVLLLLFGGGAERLGTRSGTSTAESFAAEARAAWGDIDREIV